MSGGKEGEISVDVGVPAGSSNISIGRRRVRSVSQPVRGVLTPGVELDQDVDQVGGQQSEVAGGSRDDVPLTARTSYLRVVSQPAVVTRSGQVRSEHNIESHLFSFYKQYQTTVFVPFIYKSIRFNVLDYRSFQVFLVCLGSLVCCVVEEKQKVNN